MIVKIFLTTLLLKNLKMNIHNLLSKILVEENFVDYFQQMLNG